MVLIHDHLGLRHHDGADSSVRWPHTGTTVAVVRDGRRLMVDAPVPAAHMEGLGQRPFVTSARTAALPWDSMGEDHVVLDTVGRRALIVAPYTAGVVPHVPGSKITFEDIPGMRRLEHRGYWSAGLSFSPDGRRAANVECHEDGPHLVILDLVTGERRYLTALPGMAGDEPPMWSPDGRWVLVSGHRRNLLVSPTHHVMVSLDLDLPYAAATWWPQAGNSSLMLLHGEPGNQAVSVLNLATCLRAEVARVELGPVLPGDMIAGAIWHPMMSPDGDRVLVGDTRGTSGAYQASWGACERLAVLDPRTGVVVPLSGAFVDGTMIERDHSRWSWSAPQRPGRPIELHSTLRAAARPLDLSGRGSEPRTQAQSLWYWKAGD